MGSWPLWWVHLAGCGREQKRCSILQAHGIEKIGHNHFLIFDNVYHDKRYPKTVSRWLEIKVDPEKKIAREHRFWVAPPPRLAHQMGDADRMPNGNTLMSITSTDQITEASPDGQIAWEMMFPAPPHGKGGKWWIYHAEKFMLTPLVKPDQEEYSCTGETCEVAVTIWNTVRVRYRAKGRLDVLKADASLVSIPISFNINWIATPVTLRVPTSQLECGSNPLTVRCTNADDIPGDVAVRLSRRC
eukprot:NODE_2568_length_1390_cov_2.544594_g2441_i0.p2 GENE.NODE_2568_length_1390_cov_2.544594_g2441_i0~~NODE_2568_length_1390_cov_2.544594_g2441_i0.p2  ORF type:complete len:244 (-),score=43.34 NODE_2568_length_1390_cov_2.544594_g2441_i0:64-795(-)